MKKYLYIAGTVVVIGTLLLQYPIVYAANAGPSGPLTTVDDATVGTQAWTTPNNAQVSDGVFALETLSASIGNILTHYLIATNFGFSIPSGATILGILMEAQVYDKGFVSDNFVQDNSVRIVKGGVIGSTNMASTFIWPPVEAYIPHGNSTNLWGQTWTPSDINASNFGTAISAVSNGANFAQGGIDYIRITVYYSLPNGITTKVTQTAGKVIQTQGTVIIP